MQHSTQRIRQAGKLFVVNAFAREDLRLEGFDSQRQRTGLLDQEALWFTQRGDAATVVS
jgi:hypothetical protein